MGLVTMTALADTNSTNTDTTRVTSTTQGTNTMQQFNGIQMMEQGDQGFGGGHGGSGHGTDSFNGMNGIEISSEYNATVTSILESDTDVANLISEGYNVTSINPVVKTVVEGDGTIATKATTAVVIMTNGTSGIASLKVDLENSKVTYITIVTKTVIDKNSS
jgi:hypothetical protein